MSAGAAIAVAVSVASDVRGCVDERGYLELVPVPIRNIREGLGKVDVFVECGKIGLMIQKQERME